MDGRLTLRVLGGCDAYLDGAPVDLGGPRQRSVLARLLVAGGAVVPAEKITDDLWRGEPPPRALGALQAYVSHLRRALEPDRPPRAPAQVLVSSSPGYALRLPVSQVDAWHATALVRDGVRAVPTDPAAARRDLGAALELWAGTAYAAFADEEWAAAESARLEELRRVAVEHLAEADLALGQPVSALALLEPHAAQQPLRENGWRLLALALYRAGRQADALAALRTLRRALSEELGVDPSPAVQRLERDILDHAPGLEATDGPAAATAHGSRSSAVPAAAAGAVASPPAAGARDQLFVGRGMELAALVAAADRARATGVELALVSGEPGAGKSALLEELSRRLRGWAVAWGRCPEVEGAPPLYPWTELLRPTVGRNSPAEALRPLLDDGVRTSRGDVASQRFRLHRAVGSHLRDTAVRQPLVLVLDDLHRADAETLALLVDVLPDLSAAPVLVVGTYRHSEIHPPLAEALGALAGASPTRIELAGLPPDEAGALVRQTATSALGPDVVADIVARTEGNPFFVRESARLAGSGETSVVPEGVRDVIHRRVARLPATAHTLLKVASLLGRDVDVDLLLALAEVDEDDALDAVDSALVSGLLEEPAPGLLRFSHALVQETLYAEISLLRRARWHARVGAALERLHPDDHAALAHHYRRAGRAYAENAMRYAALAAEQADRRHAYAASVELWRQAMAGAGELPTADPATVARLHAGLVRTFGHSGNAFEASAARRHGIEAVRSLGDPSLVPVVLAAWDTPSLWTTHPYGAHDHQLIAEVTDSLDRLGERPETTAMRARLLTVLALETEGLPDDVVQDAPARALALARELSDPVLVCASLDGVTRHGHGRLTGPELDAVAEELLAVAQEHDLAVYQGLAHTLLQQRAGAYADLEAALFHGTEMDRIGRTYGLPGLQMVARQVPAQVALARGQLDEAERLFRDFGKALAEAGAHSVDIYDWDVSFLLGYARGSTAGLVDEMGDGARTCPPLQPLLVHALLADGRRQEAEAIWTHRRPPTRDIMWGMYAAVDADNLLVLGTAEQRAAAYEHLRLLDGEIAAGATGFFVLPPADVFLARLAASLGRQQAAHDHWTTARAVAERAGNAAWLQQIDAEHSGRV